MQQASRTQAAAKKEGKEEEVEMKPEEPASELLEARCLARANFPETHAENKGAEPVLPATYDDLPASLMAAAVQVALALEDWEVERQEDSIPANLVLAAEGEDGLPDVAAERQRQGQYVQDDEAARELLERLPSAQVT